MIISTDKKYKTRSGLPVRVLCTDRKDEDSPVLALVSSQPEQETVRSYDINGNFINFRSDHHLDLIEVTLYDHIQIDDKIFAWDHDDCIRHKGHFAGTSESGKPQTWLGGRTSWTVTTQKKYTWDHCELAEESE